MPTPADCTHPESAIFARNGQFTSPSDVEPAYECRLCGARRDSVGDFSIFRQSDWLRVFIQTALRHGCNVAGVEHEHFLPGSYFINVDGSLGIASVIEALKECDESTLWLQLPNGKRCAVSIIWQGPDDTYQQADEIVADYAGPPILDEIWTETKQQTTSVLARANPQWSGN